MEFSWEPRLHELAGYLGLGVMAFIVIYTYWKTPRRTPRQRRCRNRYCGEFYHLMDSTAADNEKYCSMACEEVGQLHRSYGREVRELCAKK